jgi:endonuclease YncB( thermonuclease family)
MKWTTLFVLAFIINLTGCNKSYKVVEVVDGDTIILKPFLQVRIIGIDAPELNIESQKFKDDLERYEANPDQETKYALESKMELQKLVLNKKVTIKSAQDFDYEILENGRTGRALRFVYIANKDVGKLMIEKGFARTWNNSSIQPPYRHLKEKEYTDEEMNAKIIAAGVWQNLGTEKKE